MFPPETASPSNLVIPQSETGLPQVVSGTALGNNGAVFNHAYAIVALTGSVLSINYYQIDSTDATPGNPPPLTPIAYQDNVATPNAANAAARKAGG